MSSSLRRIQKKLSDTRRKGLTTRGRKPGGGAPPRVAGYTGHPKHDSIPIGPQHDMKKADPKCKRCRGSGAIASVYGNNEYLAKGKRSDACVYYACRCVPIKEVEDES